MRSRRDTRSRRQPLRGSIPPLVTSSRCTDFGEHPMATATQLSWLLTPDDASIAGKPSAQGGTPCEVGRRPSSRTGVLSVGRFTPPDGKFDNSAPRRTSPEASICTDMRVARWSPPTPSRHCLAARRPKAARHGVRPRQRLNSHPLAPDRAESVVRFTETRRRQSSCEVGPQRRGSSISGDHVPRSTRTRDGDVEQTAGLLVIRPEALGGIRDHDCVKLLPLSLGGSHKQKPAIGPRCGVGLRNDDVGVPFQGPI